MPARRTKRTVSPALRDTATTMENGCRVIGAPPTSPFLDGSETRVLQIVNAAADRSSRSDELAIAGIGWPDRYHLWSARANVLRGFDLPKQARVLEIGAGCGAVTRFLGERCAFVDALEPVAERAVIARTRTQDLEAVEVIVGSASDVHCAKAYDLAVVCGVLEYVGGGSSDRAPYLDFLTRIHEALVDGGALLLAIENRLGAKYLAGAPEDHTGRPYEGVEGYLHPGSHARTFARSELEALFADAGFTPRTFAALPDYKFTGVLLDDRAARLHPAVVAWLREFTADGAAGDSWSGVSESALWRQLLATGVAMEFANSFVVVATKGSAAFELWPEQRLAAVFQPGRLPSQSHGRALLEGSSGLTLSAFQETVGSNDETEISVPDGLPMAECLRTRSAGEAEILLHRWERFVTEHVRFGSPAPVGWIPPFIFVDAAGSLHPAGEPLLRDGWSVDDVIARGALVTGLLLADTTPPTRWGQVSTAADVVQHIGRLLGLEETSWLAHAVQREAALQAELQLPPSRAAGDDAAGAIASRLHSLLNRATSELTMGPRGVEAAQQQRQLVAEMQREIAAQRTALDALRAERDAADTLANRMISSMSWRATRPARVALRAAKRVVR